MAYISDKELNELRSNADIVEIVSSYIPLSVKGKNFWGVCPFHQDHSPSMSVSKEKQIYKCFSCGASGNVFSFVQNYENVSFAEAIKIVADKSGFVLSNNFEFKKQEKYNNEYQMMDIAMKYYENNLNSSKGKEAKDYLTKRGLDAAAIKEFNIGLSLNNNALNKILEQKGYDYNQMRSVGLISEKSTIYDTFFDRIMFPIHNIEGKVVAFTGRVFNKENQAKYLGSKETKIYHKSNILFNYHRALPYIKTQKELIIVEGNMDAIRMYISGIKNTIALMGTALTTEQLQIIKKLKCRVILMLDNDTAGEKATYDMSFLLEKEKIETLVVRLENEKDPDSYIIKNSVDAMMNNIKNAIPVNEFKLNYLKKDKNLNNTDDLVKYVKIVLDDLKKSDDEILKEVTLKKLSDDYNLSYDLLKKQLDDKKEKIVNEEPKEVISKKKNAYDEALNNILYFMMNDSKFIKIYIKQLGYIDEKKYRLIASEIIYYYEKNKSINLADFITYANSSKLNKEIMDIIGNVNISELEENVFMDCITVIKKKTKENEIKKLKEELKNTMDENKKEEILQKIVNIKIGSGK